MPKHVLLVLSRPDADPLAKHATDLEHLVKSMVSGYTRLDGTYVKEHDSGRNFHSELADMKHGMTATVGNKKFKGERMDVTRKGDKFHIKPHSTAFPAKRNLSHEEAGSYLQKLHKDDGLVQLDTKHPKETTKPAPTKGDNAIEEAGKKVSRGIVDAVKKQKAAKPKVAAIGDSVHHPGHNKTGIITKVDGDKYHVLHSGGKDVWDHKDVSKVRED